MLDMVTILVEIAFVVSLIGFIVLYLLVPSKKAIESGTARGRMDSPLVPVLLVTGILLGIAMIPLSLMTDLIYNGLIGLITAPMLLIAHGEIFREYLAARKMMSKHEAVEAVSTVPHPHGLTVECPRCRGHLTIPHGSNSIVCPHCGLNGSL